STMTAPTNPTGESTTRRDPATLTWRDVTLDDVRAARERIMPHLHRTPLLATAALSDMTNTRLGLKGEAFQRTGSFKARGALNAMLRLSPEERERGVITLSAGNHGQGIAFAAAKVGVTAHVFMPETAVPTKVAAIRGYGAECHFAPSMDQLFPAMDAFRIEHGLTYIPPFAHPDIVAGQGVVGLEILEDLPDVGAIVVPIGGGGLISGIATAVKALKPDVRIVGVEPEGASVVSRSLAAGTCLQDHAPTSIADGLCAPFAAPLTQSIIGHLVDELVLVSDEEIVGALHLILERCKVLVEPSGAAAVAALLAGKAGIAPGTPTVAVLSGGNIDRARLKTLL
ncbi:MAG: threonine ammonia-lyase, partial [Thermomicrobiales bacterium]